MIAHMSEHDCDSCAGPSTVFVTRSDAYERRRTFDNVDITAWLCDDCCEVALLDGVLYSDRKPPGWDDLSTDEHEAEFLTWLEDRAADDDD